MTESEVLPIQPVEVMVPVMVYTVVIIGFAVTIDPIEALKPEEGDQVQVFAPEAVNIIDEPIHITAGEGLTTTLGIGFTVTITVS